MSPFFRLLIFSLSLQGLCYAAQEPIDLAPSEISLYSRHGEDGVLAALFQQIGTPSRYCVDLGAGDGITDSNTYLLRLQGWGSLLLDRAHENLLLRVHKEFITAENINALLEKYKAPFEFDLLSITTSYNAFHFWKALHPQYRPSVVVIEYNSLHPPAHDCVVRYAPYFCGDRSGYFGASLLALVRLGKAKGYTLIYGETKGETLFFLRDDILRRKKLSFKNMDDPDKLYHPSHRERAVSGGLFLTAEEILKK